jgi:hypothetical protein
VKLLNYLFAKLLHNLQEDTIAPADPAGKLTVIAPAVVFTK